MTTFTVNPAAPASLKVDHDLTSYNGVIVDNIDKIESGRYKLNVKGLNINYRANLRQSKNNTDILLQDRVDMIVEQKRNKDIFDVAFQEDG